MLRGFFCFARLLTLQHAPNKPNFTISVLQIFGCQTTHCVQGGCIRYNRSATLRDSSSSTQRFFLLRKAQSSPSETPLSRLHRLHKLHRFFRAELPWSHNIVQGLVLCATIALHCTGIALYCTGIVQGLGCSLCIPHLMISCGSISPSIRKLQYEVTIAIAWLSHFLLEQLSLQTSLFSFLLLYPYPSMVGIFVVIRLSVGLDNFS